MFKYLQQVFQMKMHSGEHIMYQTFKLINLMLGVFESIRKVLKRNYKKEQKRNL